MGIEYVEYDETKHLDQLVKLEYYLWNNQTEDELKAIFKWKYRKRYNFSNAFVAIDNNCIVAFRGFFINQYKVRNNIYPIAVFADAVTHPKYRGKGVFSRLTVMGMKYLKENGVIGFLALSSNNKSSSGYLKLGSKSLAEKETSFRFIYNNIFAGRKHRFLNFDKKITKKDLKVIVFNTMTENLAMKLSAFSADRHMPLITLDKDIFFWTNRYASPHFQYKYCLLYKNENLMGYTIYREVYTTKISHVKILDIDSIDSGYFEILIKCVDHYTSCKIMSIFTTCMNNECFLNLRKKFPFKQKGRMKDQSNCILLKKTSNAVDDKFFFEKKNWLLSYIDLDNM